MSNLHPKNNTHRPQCINCLEFLSSPKPNPTQGLPLVTLESQIPSITSACDYAQALSIIFSLPPLDPEYLLGNCYLCELCATNLNALFQLYEQLFYVTHQVGLSAFTSADDSSPSSWFYTLKERAHLILGLGQDVKPEPDLIDIGNQTFDDEAYDYDPREPDPSFEENDDLLSCRPCYVKLELIGINLISPLPKPRICSSINQTRPKAKSKQYIYGTNTTKKRRRRIREKPTENPNKVGKRKRDLDPEWDPDPDSDLSIKVKRKGVRVVADPSSSDSEGEKQYKKQKKSVDIDSTPKTRPTLLCPRTPCQFQWATRKKLLAHLLLSADSGGHSEPPTTKICRWCGNQDLDLEGSDKCPFSVWPTHKEYLLHIQSHAGQPTVPTCTDCPGTGRVFSMPNRLRIHRIGVHKHKDSGWSGFSCKFCGRKFTDRRGVRNHELVIHSEGPVERKFICENCGHRFLRLDQLNLHRKRVHLPEKLKNPCPAPGCTYVGNEARLKVHINNKHPADKNFQCHLCPNSYKFQHSLSEHLICHENQRKWICTAFGSSCGNRRFNRKIHLVQHIVCMHHLKRKEALEIVNRPQSQTNEPWTGDGERRRSRGPQTDTTQTQSQSFEDMSSSKL